MDYDSEDSEPEIIHKQTKPVQPLQKPKKVLKADPLSLVRENERLANILTDSE